MNLPLNIPQIVTFIVGIVLQVLTKQFGVIPPDVSDGITALLLVIYGLVANDVTDKNVWKQPTTLTSIIAGLFWFVVVAFHLNVDPTIKGLVTSILLGAVGYFTKNNSGVTVGAK